MTWWVRIWVLNGVAWGKLASGLWKPLREKYPTWKGISCYFKKAEVGNPTSLLPTANVTKGLQSQREVENLSIAVRAGVPKDCTRVCSGPRCCFKAAGPGSKHFINKSRYWKEWAWLIKKSYIYIYIYSYRVAKWIYKAILKAPLTLYLGWQRDLSSVLGL